MTRVHAAAAKSIRSAAAEIFNLVLYTVSVLRHMTETDLKGQSDIIGLSLFAPFYVILI